eukprot:scaffold48385_cov66-Phaeocystis_antarctica.AAC.2
MALGARKMGMAAPKRPSASRASTRRSGVQSPESGVRTGPESGVRTGPESGLIRSPGSGVRTPGSGL